MSRSATALLITLLVVPFAAHAALVNINTATAAQLDTLPGIGPSKAAAIIAYRQVHGPFARPADIQEVKGIGPATYANLQSLITVGEVSIAPEAPKPATVRAPVAPARVAQPAAVVTAAAMPTVSETATLSPVEMQSPGTTIEPKRLGAFSSVWTYVFLGIVVIAGGALLII